MTVSVKECDGMLAKCFDSEWQNTGSNINQRPIGDNSHKILWDFSLKQKKSHY